MTLKMDIICDGERITLDVPQGVIVDFGDEVELIYDDGTTTQRGHVVAIYNDTIEFKLKLS